MTVIEEPVRTTATARTAAGPAPRPARGRPGPRPVPPSVPRRGRMRVTGVVAAVLVLVLMVGLVAFHAVIVQRQLALDALNEQVAEAARDNELLRLEVARLEAPGRIVAEATGRLGLVEPERVVYLVPVSP